MADFKKIRKRVLELYRDYYDGDDQSVEDILATDPSDYDLDPGPFYELLMDEFEVEEDEDSDDFGGFGGTISETISFIVSQKEDE